LQGSATAPIRQHASSVKTQSALLPIRVITMSPFPIPCACKVAAKREETSSTSAKVHSRREPSAASATSARWSFGSDSKRFETKLEEGT